jgi:transcriptional regulator with XRE-family HTH domain
MAIKGKYQSWGNFLKLRREKRFRSAREFCAQVPVGISYPQYSRYESGDQLPSLDQALSLCATLGVPPLEALLEWNQAQLSMQDLLTRAGVAKLLDEIRGQSHGPASTLPGWSSKTAERTVPLDDVIVFNRSHLRVFLSDPSYRDIFTYINSFAPDWITHEEIAQALDLSTERAQLMLEQLSELGVVMLKDGACRATKRNFYFPDDEDFFALRNLNLEHNAASILGRLRHEDLTTRKAYRGLVTRELTDEQVGLLLEGVEQLIGQVVAMPETDRPRTIYSLCVLFGERFSRQPLFSDKQGEI